MAGQCSVMMMCPPRTAFPLLPALTTKVGDDRGCPRDGEECECRCAEGEEAGSGGRSRKVRCLGEEGPGDGADEGGCCPAGEEDGADATEDRVRDDPLQGGLLDDQRHGAAQADGCRGGQRGGER